MQNLTNIKVLPIYAAILAILFVLLSINTIRARRKFQIALGDAGNDKMLRAIGVHANFAEYAPFALLLLGLVELQGINPYFMHGLCLALTIGRISHAYGVSQIKEDFRFRISGMVLTFTVILTCAVILLYGALNS